MGTYITEEQLTTIIRTYQDDFYRLAYSYVKDSHLAMDMVQEMIFKAFKNRKKLNQPHYAKTWLYRILINTCINQMKKSKPTLPLGTLLDQIPAPSIELSEILSLHEAINHLDAERKSIILLRYFEDFKIEDIAYILEMNVNTVKSKLYSALKLLRIELEGDDIF
ncbi:MAG: RNA polymerase sigma factor [Bacilli bacterium]